MGLKIIAHRGDSQTAPENTWPAFERAWHLAVDSLEFDYHHSREGVPVVIHDDTLDRTTNAVQRGYQPGTRVAAVTAQELAALDAARWPDGRWEAFRPTAPPTVEAVLRRAVALKRRCLVERKAGDAQTLCQLLTATGATAQVCLIAFAEAGGWDYLRDCEQCLPGLATAYNVLASEFSPATLERLAHQYHARRLNCDHRLLTRERVAELRSPPYGFEVWAWTVNDLERARELAAWQVQAITTDIPAQLLQGLG